MYANQRIEQMGRDDMAALQLSRLQKTVKWAAEKSLFYQRKFEEAHVGPGDIKSLDDIRRLPFLRPAELHRLDSLDMLTLPFSSILRFDYISQPGGSGALNKLYTNGDIACNVELMTRCLVAAGVTNAAIVGLQGDLADSRLLDIQYALEAIGAMVVPLGMDYRQWLGIMDVVSLDTIISTPQLVMQLVVQLQATGRNIADYPIQKIICLNETIQNPLQRHLELRTQTTLFNLYSPPELGTASMLFQCDEHAGQHLQEDCFYAEVVEFDSGKPVRDLTHMGELVVTTLAAEAMPLIRYRTGQAVSRVPEACKCGRTLLRIATPFSFHG